ncbi:hypothetical protein GCM10025870_05420 [Agromyces marinus]|uniref:Lipoyl-binding domain-containing protein n=1 Tax=Agromyces marinus TaxID=1389020 RepID=A0ABN6Y8Q6_9MICO|nr:hypothetical protein GCM10025870_05420 [Agromyces marinus]
MIRDFALPDLGEGLTESEIVAWRVKVGDHVELNQIIADVETAKAVVELPSPFEGTVTALHAAEGETVNVGEKLFSCDTGGERMPRQRMPQHLRPPRRSLPRRPPRCASPRSWGTARAPTADPSAARDGSAQRHSPRTSCPSRRSTNAP